MTLILIAAGALILLLVLVPIFMSSFVRNADDTGCCANNAAYIFLFLCAVAILLYIAFGPSYPG